MFGPQLYNQLKVLNFPFKGAAPIGGYFLWDSGSTNKLLWDTGAANGLLWRPL